jgi:hypothetical protein
MHTDAVAAVTVPPFLKIAGSLARPSFVEEGFGCSSVSMFTSFPFTFIVTGAISFLKYPLSLAEIKK